MSTIGIKAERGAAFTVGGVQWMILGTDEDGCLCIGESVKTDRFSSRTNNWEKSDLRRELNDRFLSEIMKTGVKILKTETNMKALDGRTYGSCKDAVRLLTLAEYRSNRDLFPEVNEPGADFFWLSTPWTTAGHMICVVTSIGTIEGLFSENKIGVRPVMFFTWENFKTE